MAQKKFTKSKKQRDHEVMMEFMKVFQGPNGFDFALLIGAASGYGISTIMQFLTQVTEAAAADAQAAASGGATGFQGVAVGALKNNPVFGPLYTGAEGVWNMFAKKDTGEVQAVPVGSPLDGMFNFTGTVPATFANLCIMLLIIRALFGTGGMGEVLKGIGEIVPL